MLSAGSRSHLLSLFQGRRAHNTGILASVGGEQVRLLQRGPLPVSRPRSLITGDIAQEQQELEHTARRLLRSSPETASRYTTG